MAKKITPWHLKSNWDGRVGVGRQRLEDTDIRTAVREVSPMHLSALHHVQYVRVARNRYIYKDTHVCTDMAYVRTGIS